MKVTKWIDLGSQEVEIHLGAEDIRNALATDLADAEEQSPRCVTRSLNTIAGFLTALTDEQIAAETPRVRKLVSEFLSKAAQRFKGDV